MDCTNATEIRQRLHWGLPGPHSSRLERAPHMPAGMQAAVAGGSLFLISDSSACEGSALCRADTGQAHGCLSESTEDCFPGEENTGVDAAPTIPGRRGGTSAEAVTAGVWLTGSDPAPGHRPALPPGGEPTRLSSPAAPARGGPGGGCSREPGACEQAFPGPAAGVCWGGRHCGTQLPVCGRHTDLPVHPWASLLQVCVALWLTRCGSHKMWLRARVSLSCWVLGLLPCDRIRVGSPGPPSISFFSLYCAKKS